MFHISAIYVHNYLHNVNNSAIYVHNFEYTPKGLLNVLLTFIDTLNGSPRGQKTISYQWDENVPLSVECLTICEHFLMKNYPPPQKRHEKLAYTSSDCLHDYEF